MDQLYHWVGLIIVFAAVIAVVIVALCAIIFFIVLSVCLLCGKFWKRHYKDYWLVSVATVCNTLWRDDPLPLFIDHVKRSTKNAQFKQENLKYLIKELNKLLKD